LPSILEGTTSPELWETVGPQRRSNDLRRRRLTLAPAFNEVSLTPVLHPAVPSVGSDLDSGYTAVCISNQGATHSNSVYVLPDEDAYRDCLMAGYTSDEAREYIRSKEHSRQNCPLSFVDCKHLNEHLVENFWTEVGFPKGTRWWEIEKSSEGSLPDHDQCILKASSSDSSVCKSSDVEQKRPPTKPIPKRGFAMRPWRGPLPKRRSPSDITLEAFFPKETEKRNLGDMTILTRPSHTVLIERARLLVDRGGTCSLLGLGPEQKTLVIGRVSFLRNLETPSLLSRRKNLLHRHIHSDAPPFAFRAVFRRGCVTVYGTDASLP